MNVKRSLKFKNNEKLAIVVGEGKLPAIFIDNVKKNNIPFLLIIFEGISVSLNLTKESCLRCKFEEMSNVVERLVSEKINYIVFCGKMTRPELNFDIIQPKSLEILLPILNSLNYGDDHLFRSIISVFEDFGIKTLSIVNFMPDILISEGILTKRVPSELDRSDSDRAETILKSISSSDIGQGLVVSQGLCVAIETLPGTDAMLNFVSLHLVDCRPNKIKDSGILFKGKKRDQTSLIDLPTIGLETVKGAHKAGLSGIVIEENSVIVLEKDKMISLANELGIFIWSRKNKLDGNNS